MKIRQQLVQQLINLTHQLKRHYNFVCANHGITGVQASVLYFIMAEAKYRDVFQKDIEEEFFVRRSSATNILQLLERRQFIKRENVAYDARLKKIILTAKTIELEKKITADIAKINDRITRDLTADELQLFQAILKKMSHNLD